MDFPVSLLPQFLSLSVDLRNSGRDPNMPLLHSHQTRSSAPDSGVAGRLNKAEYLDLMMSAHRKCQNNPPIAGSGPSLRCLDEIIPIQHLPYCIFLQESYI